MRLLNEELTCLTDKSIELLIFFVFFSYLPHTQKTKESDLEEEKHAINEFVIERGPQSK